MDVTCVIEFSDTKNGYQHQKAARQHSGIARSMSTLKYPGDRITASRSASRKYSQRDYCPNNTLRPGVKWLCDVEVGTKQTGYATRNHDDQHAEDDGKHHTSFNFRGSGTEH
jgi:hypothetical protein